MAPCLFLVAFAAVFAARTGPWWRGGELLAGDHADGPFHFGCELVRLSPEVFPADPAVQANRRLGAYEHFYQGIHAVAWVSGWPLLKANVLMCWAGNFLYLAGVFVMLRRFQASLWACALGTWLAAQPFVFIGMASGVTHSLAIPREVWLWPMPWFVAWFSTGRREGVRLVVFYGALGAVYAFTYPLWAALLGLAFGLVDAWEFTRERRWTQFGWLVASAVACMLVVAAPMLATFRAVGGGESSLLDYNQITRSVYFTKGFRCLLLFAVAGFAALVWLVHSGGQFARTHRALLRLLIASFAVCCLYEPLQRLVPRLSLLYPGRLSFVAHLVATVAAAAWLHARWSALPRWGRALVVVVLAWMSFEPVRSTRKEFAAQTPPTRPDFVAFCREVKRVTAHDALAVMESTPGSHYFRVYAERGLWVNHKDTGVLSRSKELYERAKERLAALKAFYSDATPMAERERLLMRMQLEGATHLVTTRRQAWGAEVSWRIVTEAGDWQLRAPNGPARK